MILISKGQVHAFDLNGLKDGFMELILNISKEFDMPADFAKEEMLRLWLKLFLLKVERLKHATIPKGTTTDRIHRFIAFKQKNSLMMPSLWRLKGGWPPPAFRSRN